MADVYLLRLDVERVQRNLEEATRVPHSVDDAETFIRGLGLQRHQDGERWVDVAELGTFLAGEVVEAVRVE